MIDYYRERVAELEHTIICHQDRFRIKDRRIAMLEELARDLWQDVCYDHIYTHKEIQAFKQRMDALGLLEGEQMVSHEEVMIDDLQYECIVWTCDRCGCEVIVDIDGLPMIKDGKARNVVEPSYCPECGEALPELCRKVVD